MPGRRIEVGVSAAAIDGTVTDAEIGKTRRIVSVATKEGVWFAETACYLNIKASWRNGCALKMSACRRRRRSFRPYSDSVLAAMPSFSGLW